MRSQLAGLRADLELHLDVILGPSLGSRLRLRLGLTLKAGTAIAQVQNIPPTDKLVVRHSDACAPNTLIADDGRWSGHVDLGDLGVADRWADLARCHLEHQWNYGPGWEQMLFDAYGIKPNTERTRYYRLLWELV